MEGNTTTNNFEGKSSRGDLYEALDNAVENAKRELTTDFVEWTLRKVSGAYGGFVNAKDLTVLIEASVSKGSNFDEQAKTESGLSERSRDGQI